MMLENTQLNRATQETFSLGDKIKKVTFHQIHQFKQNNIVYIAKMFKPQHRQKYERQLNILRLLHHDNIIQLVKSIQSGQQNNNKFDMLIFKKATYGSLNEYIPLNGKFPEDIVRVLFKQIIRALKYAANIQSQGIYHPNVLPSNILLDQNHNIIICGWSSQNPLNNIKPKISNNINHINDIHNLLFSSCQILLLMLTGYPVFMNKQSILDQLYRLVKNKQMNKFWQQYLKRIQQKDKSFVINKNIKELIDKVFIKEWIKFQDIENSQWWKEKDIEIQVVDEMLKKKQQIMINKRQQKAREQLIKAETKKSLFDQLLNNQKTEQSHRGSSLSSSFTSLVSETFLNDYYEYYFPFYDVPTLLLSQYQGMIELFDDRPNFIVATMKQIFKKSLEIQLMNLLGEQVKLIKQSLQIKKNKVYFQIVLNQIDQENIENDGNITNNQDEIQDQIMQIQFTVHIQFGRNSNNQLFGDVKIIQSSLNQYFNHSILNFIEQNVQKIHLKDLPKIHQSAKSQI